MAEGIMPTLFTPLHMMVLGLLVVIAVLGTKGWLWQFAGRSSPSELPAQATPTAVPVAPRRPSSPAVEGDVTQQLEAAIAAAKEQIQVAETLRARLIAAGQHGQTGPPPAAQ